jgi:predicted nucleic acid-binding protein
MGRKKSKATPKGFVLDCSVVIAWFFEDEAVGYAEAVEDSLAAATAVVPSLWPLEVANALLIAERRKRTTEAKVSAFLKLLRSLPIQTDDETTIRAWHEPMHLARAQQLSVYDSTYLELALRRGLPLATLDNRLKAVAATVGVPEYEP